MGEDSKKDKKTNRTENQSIRTENIQTNQN